ncbi:Transcription repressor OFP13 [Zea mays]|jgi:uncharacterized protein (TIGR01568 family)|uniref:Transcription repressor n=2 Tax=Zea mays TaxID=4577 RepID=A0A3L6FZ92_MAIZE|eukprot:XP_008669847.1 transcription repressor OFP13 [Zea mays]
MGRKGGPLASIFSSSRQSKPGGTAAAAPTPPWPWPSCATKPQTASFRRQGSDNGDGRKCTTAAGRRFDDAAAAAAPGVGGRLRPPRGAAAPGDEMYKTVNSVYFDAADSCRSFFFFDDDGGGGDAADDDVLDDDGSFSTMTASEEWSEAVIRSLGRTSTGRFFFDAGPAAPVAASTNSILAASKSSKPLYEAPPSKLPRAVMSPPVAGVVLTDDDGVSEAETETEVPSSSSSLLEESVAVALDSDDPFRDFRASMHEMVAAHGLRDWAALQEMLLWYLRINGKHNHALIVGAFVDLLVGLATSSAASHSATTATTTTTTTTACCCSSTFSSSSTSSGGGGTTTTAAVAASMMDEQCGISAGASCSSVSSDLEEEAAAGERSSNNGHCTSCDALDYSCS